MDVVISVTLTKALFEPSSHFIKIQTHEKTLKSSYYSTIDT